jgi:murein DD-endopeptidase MepM/ murein hydrolase activator NlpD
MPFKTSSLIWSLVIMFAFLFAFFYFANAETADELKAKIGNTNSAIKQLEDEIKKYQSEIESLAKEKDSLSSAIKSLDLSKKKLQADTKVTESKIAAKNLEIKELGLQIGDKSERIVNSKRVIAQSLYNISQMESGSAIETILSKKSFSELWKGADQLNILQGSMQGEIKDLDSLKANLESNKKQTELKKSELIALTNDLKNQTKIIADTIAEKNSILADTKNTEAGYKQMMATRKAQKEEFESEVLAFEEALKAKVDPSSLPSTGAGVLKWPLANIRITQNFGNTAFATKNPQAYAGKGHNGIDLAASAGTPVKSALGGTVVGTGNMDLVNGGKCKNSGSYGKWILVKHYNGLTTLYGHLSQINVSAKQQVSTGEVIALSGYSGTVIPQGPRGAHLHFTVFASDGVSIEKLTTGTNCRGAVFPMAVRSAYLNPLSYLP